MKKYDLKILQTYVDKRLLHMQVHPTLPLRIYKYTQECVFSRSWDDITMNMRGTVLDSDGNVYSNPFPKFFNYDELEMLGISLPNLPYKVYDKVDGSLIEAFRYNGQLVVASAGSFTSPQALVSEKILNEKYEKASHFISDERTFLFELVYPKNKIVLDYGEDEKLILLAVRETSTGEDVAPDVLQFLATQGFDVVEEVNIDFDSLKQEVLRPDFINKEGFVVVFENGFRVKMKYNEYFRLHKIISNVNERFVWEFISQGKPIELENIPDETFQFIKDTQKQLQLEFDAKWQEAQELYEKITKELTDVYKEYWTKKEFALAVVPRHKKMSGVLFKLYEKRYEDAKEIIWKKLRPKYIKGEGGFQSMKIEA